MIQHTKWSIDHAHSEITFKVSHLMIANVTGGFKTFDASIYTINKDFTTAEIDLWIDTASISTGNAERDEHLKGIDFFDTKKHKQITFSSSSIENADQEGNYGLWGALTICGITRNVYLNVHFGGIVYDPWGNEKAGFSVTGHIKRRDWGLNWNTMIEMSGIMVGDEITISCEIELSNVGKADFKMELEHQGEKDTIL
jgi:polyisoprenoid-binding protein YceI